MVSSIRHLCILALLILGALRPGVVAGAEADPTRLLDSLFSGDAEEAERVVLVLHRGRPGNELATGSRLNMYRPRGYSRDATWNRRTARAIADRHGLSYLTDWWMSEIDVNCAVLRIEDEASIDAVLAELRSDPEVVTAERLKVFNTLTGLPNDPYYELQVAARYFELSSLHERTTGRNVLIAVVDTGIQARHQDLAGQIAMQKNFVEQVSPGFADDLHGTAVAGVIVAHANNGTGIVGMAPGARLTGLKACWPIEAGRLEARCNSFTLALAINQAMADGAQIINLSLAGPPDRIVEILIQDALRKGVIVVAATGQDDGTVSGSFPASIPGVIAVTGSGADNWRSAGQPVFAPSANVLTTLPGDSYNFLSGTSLGAALVSGYAALLLQENPRLSAADIHQRLLSFNNARRGQDSGESEGFTPGVNTHSF